MLETPAAQSDNSTSNFEQPDILPSLSHSKTARNQYTTYTVESQLLPVSVFIPPHFRHTTRCESFCRQTKSHLGDTLSPSTCPFDSRVLDHDDRQLRVGYLGEFELSHRLSSMSEYLKRSNRSQPMSRRATPATVYAHFMLCPSPRRRVRPSPELNSSFRPWLESLYAYLH